MNQYDFVLISILESWKHSKKMLLLKTYNSGLDTLARPFPP